MAFTPTNIALAERGPENPYLWVLQGELRYKGFTDSTVPSLFVTDLASIPRVLTWLIPRYGLYTKAAVVHDFLCQTSPDRFEADRVFLEGMTELGVPVLRRRLMWAAVTWATAAGHLLRRWPLTLAAAVLLGLGALIVRPFEGWWLAAWVALLVAAAGLLVALIVSAPERAWNRLWIVLRSTVWTIVGLPLVVIAIPLAIILGIYLVVETRGRALLTLGRWLTAPFGMLRAAPPAVEEGKPEEPTPREKRLTALIREEPIVPSPDDQDS